MMGGALSATKECGSKAVRKTSLVWLMTLAGLAGAQSLDYQTYKAIVEPIFLKKRPTHISFGAIE
jgi:hypothetical protein